MTVADKLLAFDAILLDRIFQPIVDFAAPFDVKGRHLSAGFYIAAGSILLLERGLEGGGVVGLLCCTVSAHLVAVHRVRIPDRDRLGFSICAILVSASCALVVGLLSAAFGFLYFVALYFSACQDKPPKRRRWKELKRAIDTLAWTPKLPGGEAA